MLSFFVIVPAYDNAAYLPGCLDSLQAQSYPHWSCVVVNDASHDDTSAVAHRYAEADPRIQAIDLPKNGGQHQARIEGMRHAKGDYVLFLDADDELAPHTLFELAHVLAGGDYDVCHFGLQVIDEGAGPEASAFFEHDANRPAGVMDGAAVLTGSFSYRGGYAWDWRVTQRAYAIDVARAGFERVAHERVEYAEDAYEAFVLADLTRCQVTVSGLRAYRYHYGRGANGVRSRMGLSDFEAIAPRFGRVLELIDAYAATARNRDVALECARDMHHRLGLALFDDWFRRLSGDDQAQAVGAAVVAIGAKETAWNLMRLVGDDVGRAWYHGSELEDEEALRALWDAADRLAGDEPEADYQALRDEAGARLAQLRRTPLVTVLVPVYNQERYLRHCLDSLLGQTLRDLQIVCLNDGSYDGSRAILEEYAARDQRVEVVDKPNSGYGASMNLGLRRARGTYVGLVESDDFAEPTMFEELVALIEASGADVVKSNHYQHVSGRPASQDELVPNVSGTGPVGEAFSPADHTEVLCSSSAIWSCLYRRSFIQQEGLDFLETPGAAYQDTSFNLKALAAARTVALTERAYLHYRVDNAASSVRSAAKVFYICDEYAAVWRFLRARPSRFDAFARRVAQVQFDGYEWNIDRLARSYREQFFRRFHDEFADLEQEGLLSQDLFGEGRWQRLRTLLDEPDAYLRVACGAPNIWRTILVEPHGSFMAPQEEDLRRLRAYLGAINPVDEVVIDDRFLSAGAREMLREAAEGYPGVRFLTERPLSEDGFVAKEELRGNALRVDDLGGRDVALVRAARKVAGLPIYQDARELARRLRAGRQA